jgi:hypothetical protein
MRAKAEASRRGEVERRAVESQAADPARDDPERADVWAALHEELDRIPASYRAALVACYLEGRTHEEAATLLKWPVGTVRSRLARGRDRLRDRLARRGLAPGIALLLLARPVESIPAGLRQTTARSSFSYVAGRSATGKVPASVAGLAERVIRAMNLRTMGNFAAVALAVGAVAGILPFVTMSASRQAEATAAPTQGVEPDHSGSLAGVVRDSEGSPVAGATVVAGAFTDQPNHRVAVTGADGRFAFQSKQGDGKLAYVLAYKEGLAPASKFLSGGANGSPSDDTVITPAKAERFVGAVRDRGGAPIARATVRIRYMRGPKGRDDRNPIFENVLEGTSLESLFRTTTDEQGGFRFPAVPPPHRVVLAVSANGMGELSSEVPGDYEAGYISGTAARPARLTMEPEARIKGRVVTELPGVGVAGLKVALQSTNDSARFWRTTRTDAAGRFELRGLPEGGGNIFLVDHPNDGPWTYRAINNLALHPGKTAEVTIELIEGALVEGMVVDAATGDPVPGVFIGMYGPARPDSGPAITSMKTDEKGRYRFRLPPGKTRLYTSGGLPRSYAGQIVVIPADVKIFTAPALKVKNVKPAEPAPRPAPAPDPARAAKGSTHEILAKTGTLELAGIVRDVSGVPIGGATVVGA